MIVTACYLWLQVTKMTTKETERLLKAFKKLAGHCVDQIGIPKKPTAKQLHEAVKVIYKFESKIKNESSHS